jgi:hypothetical protein
MRKTFRVAVAGCAALSTLAFAGTAFAAYTTPKLVASSQGGAGMRIGAVVSNTDDPTARAAIYIPNGYTLSAAPAGTKLGAVTATAAAADLGGAILPLTGELDAVDPNALTAAQKAGISICLNGASASQTWVLHLTAAGQTLDVPMLVVAAAAPEAAVGYQAKLLVCLPPPDVPSGTPGRAQFGAKLLSATFGVSAIKPPATAGDSRWTAAFTPYNPGVGTVNAGGTVETQSIVHVPTTLTLKYTKKRLVTSKVVKGKRVTVVSTKVTYSTTVTEAGQAATGPVVATAGGKKVGGARGSFTFKGAAVTLTATADLHRGASVPTGAAPSNADLFYTDLGASACTKTPIFGGVPCVAATVARATPKASVRITGFRR